MKRIYTSETTEPDRLMPVSYHARAAVVIGLFVFFMLLLLLVSLGVRPALSVQISLALAAIASTVFGVRWAITATNTEIDRRKPYISEPQEPESIQFADVDQVARQVLELHYLDGREATRPECEYAGIQQRDWNKVNQVFLAIGIKKARSWGEGTFEEALALYRACVRVDQRAIWYRPTPTATSWSRIDR